MDLETFKRRFNKMGKRKYQKLVRLTEQQQKLVQAGYIPTIEDQYQMYLQVDKSLAEAYLKEMKKDDSNKV